MGFGFETMRSPMKAVFLPLAPDVSLRNRERGPRHRDVDKEFRPLHYAAKPLQQRAMSRGGNTTWAKERLQISRLSGLG